MAKEFSLPVTARPLAHYVLFGPSDQPATQVNLSLAQDYLLAFAPTIGFSPDEAATAKQVTIIADKTAVSQQIEAGLVASGTQVQRVQGTVAEIAQALSQRIASGHPF